MRYNAGIDTDTTGWLNLHRNENLFLDNAILKEIVINAVKSSAISTYPDTSCQALKSELARLYQIDPKNIFIGNGADEVLSSLLFLLRKKFDQVNLPRIGFKMYDFLAEKYNYEALHFYNYPISEQENISDKQGLFIIDSPSSITGSAISDKTFDTIISDKKNLLIFDNVYGEFNDDPMPKIRENLVVVRHFSKFYGLAALRVGYCIAPEEIINDLNYFKEPFNVNSIGMLAAIECLKRYEYFRSKAQEAAIAKTNFEKQLAEANFTVCKSTVNFLLVKHKYIDAAILHRQLEKRKIATRHFSADPYLKEYIRITIPPKDQAIKAIDSINEIIKSIY